MPALTLDVGGVQGDRHYGVMLPSNSRQSRCYPRGTSILNRRHVSLVSEEELLTVQDRLGLPDLRPHELGANVLVRGLPKLSAVPIGARLVFDDGVGLVCEGVNQPCHLPLAELRKRHPDCESLNRFIREAFGRRGIVASVERPGSMTPGERGRLFLPELHATLT